MSELLRMRADLARLARSVEEKQALRNNLDVEIGQGLEQLRELETAIRVTERYAGREVIAASEPFNLSAPSTDEQPMRKLLEAALRAIPGGKLSDFQTYVKQVFGRELNPKSAGNTLWYMKKDGVARRDGQRWYPAEQNARSVQ